MDVYFKGEKVGTYIPDQIVNEEILIEIKCKPFLTKEDEKQFWHYLKASEYKLGLLVNFGPKKLDIKRRIYDQARDKQRGKTRTNNAEKRGQTTRINADNQR